MGDGGRTRQPLGAVSRSREAPGSLRIMCRPSLCVLLPCSARLHSTLRRANPEPHGSGSSQLRLPRPPSPVPLQPSVSRARQSEQTPLTKSRWPST